MTVRPAKTQISLCIRLVWTDSSLSAWWKFGSLATRWAHSEDSDQTWGMLRLIWVFPGRTIILLVLSSGGSFMFFFLFFSDCSLFSLTKSTDERLSTSPFYEIDPSTRGNCLHEGLEMGGCYHLVYKQSWSDCYFYGECNTCTTLSSSGYDKYDLECIAG